MREVVVSSLTASQGPALEICKGAVRSREPAAPCTPHWAPYFLACPRRGEHEGETRTARLRWFPPRIIISYAFPKRKLFYFKNQLLFHNMCKSAASPY